MSAAGAVFWNVIPLTELGRTNITVMEIYAVYFFRVECYAKK